ncbi:helix-turn-helix transcriptional regulator [Aquihabitans sp. McL0605]|uniref:helix-turn-helix transcriptional regulator n=1 Tax=Aquihabitans sp. McL0605 TaxID=3415671 RepID=UPI003CF0E9A9
MGRSQELLAFEGAVASARDGLPVVVLVSGEAGIGKTAILQEGAARCEVALHVGRCVQMGGAAIPLAPLADLLRQVDRANIGVLGQRPELAPLVRWMGSDRGDRADTGATLFSAVLELVAHLSEADPVIVGFEDLHWADAVTWDLFEFLARNLIDERVVLVGTYRTDEAGSSTGRRRLAALPRLPNATRVHLEGLGLQDVHACVVNRLGGSAAPQLVDEILARGQGNPFFTEELIAAHAAGEDIPAVLSDLISADVAALDDPARHVLGAVAAVGRETSHDLLRAVVGLDDAAVESAVRSALDAHLLVVDRETEAYRFRHALIGEVVYADLLPPQRTRLHRRVADALREQTTDALSRADRAGELAFHLDRTGDHEAAFTALLAAADAAEEVAPAVALAQLERALELWDEVGSAAEAEDRSRRLWQAAELAAGAVGNDRSVVLARTAFELGSPPEGEARGHERLARYLWGAGQLEASRVELERAVALLPGTDAVESAPVYAGLGQAELMAGHYEESERWCVKALEVLGAPHVDISSWVMARRVQGVVHSCLGDPDGGVVVCREAWSSAPTALGRALATLYYCVTLLDAGRNEECVTVALDAVAQARLSGLDTSYGGYSDALAAEGLMRQGHWAEATDLLARHADHEGNLPVGLLRVARVEAGLAARRGDPDRARALLAIASAQPVDGWHQALLDLTIAEVHLALGDWADAARAAARGGAAITSPVVLWSARFAMVATEAEVEQVLDELAAQRPIDVDQVVDRLQGHLDGVGAAVAARSARPALDTAANLAHARASLTRLTSPDPDAWAEAVERWSDLGDIWWVAVASLREADAAAATGAADRAATMLHEAHRLASELGAEPLLAQIEAVSRRTRLSLEPPERVILSTTSIDQLGLTTREAEVLVLLAAGRTNRQIGTELFISGKTASVHVSNIMRKLGVTSRVDAAAVAQRLGVPHPPPAA